MQQAARTRKGSTLVARLTMTHADGDQTIVEIHNDAGLRDFYRWYRRGKSRRIKYFVRNTGRNDATDLQALAGRVAKQFDYLAGQKLAMHASTWTGRKITNTKIIIFKKRQYRRFLECPTDQLPGYRPVIDRGTPGSECWIPSERRRSGISLGYTSVQRKMDILTGRG